MNTTTQDSRGRGEQVSTQKAAVVKLGLDVHKRTVTVARQIDGARPQPPQKMTWDAFWRWLARQQERAEIVWCCYEAGCLGYGLHRKLTRQGVHNVVVQPRRTESGGGRVKTDSRDALQLAEHLDRYVAGNVKALAVVRVPTEEEEQARSQVRFRESLREERQRLEAEGRGRLLFHGYEVEGRWWEEGQWKRIRAKVPSFLREILETLRELLLLLDQKVAAYTEQIEAEAAAEKPKGMGAYTQEFIRREICDWSRFRNRRQVGSFTGLCASEYSSGEHRRQGSVTKHGHGPLRRMLVELSWRLVRFQPNYRGCRKWATVLGNPDAPKGLRKKAIVAFARQLAVDLWRVNTGRCTAESLGLTMAA